MPTYDVQRVMGIEELRIESEKIDHSGLKISFLTSTTMAQRNLVSILRHHEIPAACPDALVVCIIPSPEIAIHLAKTIGALITFGLPRPEGEAIAMNHNAQITDAKPVFPPLPQTSKTGLVP